MDNVLILALDGLAAGHRDEEPVVAFDNLDVVNNEAVVNGERCDGTDFGVVCFFKSDTDFGNVHFCTSYVIEGRGVIGPMRFAAKCGESVN